MPASREESDNHKDVSGKVPSREAVCFVAATRRDIVFAVNKAARFTDKQGEKDWNEATRVFRCLDQPATMASGILEVLAN